MAMIELDVEGDGKAVDRLAAEFSVPLVNREAINGSYVPHCTIAYLDPAVSQSYLKGAPPFLPCTVVLDQLEWSGADHSTETITLGVLPAFGLKAIQEGKNKRGHRYCWDDQTGKRAKCPEKEHGSEPAKKPAVRQQGPTPVKQPAAPEDRHARILKAVSKTSAKIAEGIRKSPGLTDQARWEYTLNIARVLYALPPKGRRLVQSNLATAKFHHDPTTLGNTVLKRMVEIDPVTVALDYKTYKAYQDGIAAGTLEIGGAALIQSRWGMELHLDGKRRLLGEDVLARGRHRNDNTELEAYAHEIGHIIDGPQSSISKSPAWNHAWDAEIARRPDDPPDPNSNFLSQAFGGGDGKLAKLTVYAATSPGEGVAEFARLLYGSKVDLAVVERDFPQCSAIFKSLNLWPDRSGKPDAVFGDIFDQRIPLDDQGGHADAKWVGTESKALPRFGTKGIVLKRDRLQRKICYDDQTGKRVPCPKPGKAPKAQQQAPTPTKKPAKQPHPKKILPPQEFDTHEQYLQYLEHVGVSPEEVFGTPEPAAERKRQREEARRVLETADVQGWAKLDEGGANISFVTDFGNGVKGVFKPVYGESKNLRHTIPVGTYYLREVVAASVAEILGLDDLVPPTIVRELADEPGSLQLFVADANVAKEYSDHMKYDGEEDMVRAAVFDFIIGNTDRHDGNWLLANNGKKLVLIDHGLSFPEAVWGGCAEYFFDKAKTIRQENEDAPRPIPPQFRKWAAKADEIVTAVEAAGLSSKAIYGLKKRLKLLGNSRITDFKQLAKAAREAQREMELM